MKKAFDRVWIKGLLYKMHVAGLNSSFIRLMYSYLNDRKIKVKINNELSTEKLIKAGVPQGSVLEPSLFNFYTHEMPAFIQTKNKKRLL
jgi:retron-type reverse transcriptase